jgi:hypothetical protein
MLLNPKEVSEAAEAAEDWLIFLLFSGLGLVAASILFGLLSGGK